VLLGREIFVPPRKALNGSSHRFASTKCLTQVLIGSRATLSRELAAASGPVHKPVRNCTSKEV